jgi:hypothetical protein
MGATIRGTLAPLARGGKVIGELPVVEYRRYTGS